MINKIKIVLRNPFDKRDEVDYDIVVDDHVMAHRWYAALNGLLLSQAYLEKNFCFLGFPDSPRTIDLLCEDLNWAKNKINGFFGDYKINEIFSPLTLRDGLHPNQELMNQLHNHFEILQGTVWGLSEYYRRADYETKYAIRQLNNICHEAESLMLSQKKKHEAPEWVRPSQITTFLNAPRFEYPAEHKKIFSETSYDREFGGVYLHWTQIGKTLYEVYIDEKGKDVDDAICDAITHLRYYSGEFDIEWARDVTYGGDYPWHSRRIDGFRDWLIQNKFDLNDTSYNYGYHRVGKVDMISSFGTNDHEKVWEILSNHLDIAKIETYQASSVFDYCWNDPGYRQTQIDFLKPGYDYSSR